MTLDNFLKEDTKVKRIISILLTMAMMVSLISVSSTNLTKADEKSDWQKNAITAPVQGKLVGAGYIDIKFDGTLENASGYQVYFDGKNECDLVDGTKAVMTFDAKGLSKEAKCEVYTTQVSAHTAYVVATMKDGTEVKSDEVTFYVSKKGVALGADMSSTVKLSDMNCAWYYNWAPTQFNSVVDNFSEISVAPMIWGKDVMEQIPDITSKDKYILGFNEPDHPEQSNLTVDEAVELWKDITATGRRTVAPAVASSTEWLDAFVKKVDEDENLRCDAIPMHFYTAFPEKGQAQVLLNKIDELYKRYNRPIWLTEVSVWGQHPVLTNNSYQNPTARKNVENFMKEIVEGLEERPYVERYSWFPYNINSANEIDGAAYSGASALFDYETGAITQLGELYASLGNPEGYQLSVITNKYVEKEETTTQEPTTKKNVTTQPATTSAPKKKAKPAKVSVKKATNVKKLSVKLIWKSAKNAKKYQVQYSLDKKFRTAKKYKTKTVTTKKVTYTVKKLTKKKKYYFRIRGVNGKTYGSWSKVKKVSIKK